MVLTLELYAENSPGGSTLGSLVRSASMDSSDRV